MDTGADKKSRKKDGTLDRRYLPRYMRFVLFVGLNVEDCMDTQRDNGDHHVMMERSEM